MRGLSLTCAWLLLQQNSIRRPTLPVLNIVFGGISLLALVGMEAKMFWRYARCWQAGHVWCAPNHGPQTPHPER